MSFEGTHAPVWEQRLSMLEDLTILQRNAHLGSVAIQTLVLELIEQSRVLRETDPNYPYNALELARRQRCG